jgi:predicted transport protein
VVKTEIRVQTLIERNLEPLLGIRLLASEYSTGATHAGRIDTLGLDENGYPVILEYKRAVNENVVSQGLYYMDWLMDHRGDFELLALKKLGAGAAEKIEWSTPRLLCIAGDFTKYDEHAIRQMPRAIELIRYRRYGDDLLLFEQVSATAPQTPGPARTSGEARTIMETIDSAGQQLRDRWEGLKDFLLALGDDVQMKTLKHYIAFKRLQNFACVQLRTQDDRLLVYAKVDPTADVLVDGFTRDVRKIGHYGTGDLEITIGSDDDFKRAQPLLVRSYEAS